jgi:ribosomal protein S9
MDAARAGLTKMIAAADPATRELLQKFPKLVEVRPIQNTAIIPNLAQGFMGRHQENVEVAKEGTAELLFEVERKKVGLRKARKRPQYSKR